MSIAFTTKPLIKPFTPCHNNSFEKYMLRIKDLPIDERPREKLWQLGSENLSDSELLAILLRTGTRGKSAIDLARDLLSHFKSLQNLFTASSDELCKISGISKNHFAQLQAAHELYKRALNEELVKPMTIRDQQALHQFLRSHLAHQSREVFAVLFFNAPLQLIAYEELFYGSISKATIHPREIIKRALHHNAAAIVLAHNHPSGDSKPSQDDIYITKVIKESLQWLEVKILQHVVVGKSTCHDIL